MLRRRRKKRTIQLTAGWAVYLRTSSDENQKPEMSRARQRYAIENNVLNKSDMPVYQEYIDVLTGSTPHREAYQQLLEDARQGKFSHVIVERADRFGRNDTEALRAIDELDEFGVAVRFANQPDLDPMDPDDRVIVTLSFTLARRESALLSLRVKGEQRAKRDDGGFVGRTPDGYRNVSRQLSGSEKRLRGRHEHCIELDPERAPIMRFAWDLLLTGTNTLQDICEELHHKGYRHKSGRPYMEVTKSGTRRANYNTLSRIFHNWTYAGWVTSAKNNIPPKTIRGNWEALVTTDEMERGLIILAEKNQKKVPHRGHDYLLSGFAYYKETAESQLVRLTCSKVNTGRRNGGTAYYRSVEHKIRFACNDIDRQIGKLLLGIQVDKTFLHTIRSAYTDDIANKMGHLQPDEQQNLELALKAIDDEEARAARLFVSGKITETVWDNLWVEWQDKRDQ
ncbi:MAG: recombinase family protein, partial [Chloroflexota bacterium]